jgi:hypothetical protein
MGHHGSEDERIHWVIHPTRNGWTIMRDVRCKTHQPLQENSGSSTKQPKEHKLKIRK